MKITAIAAVGAALLGVFLCQPAVAKGSDVPAAKRQLSNVKQVVKAKAKKPVLPGKTAKKKPAVKAKPGLAKAPAKDAKPTEASSVKPGPATVADGLPPFVQANRRNFDQNERTRVASMTVAMAPCQKAAKAVSIIGNRHSAMAGNSCNTQDLDSPAELANANSRQAPVKKPGNANLVTFFGKPSVAPPRQSGGSAYAGQTPGSPQ